MSSLHWDAKSGPASKTETESGVAVISQLILSPNNLWAYFHSCLLVTHYTFIVILDCTSDIQRHS